ncbi:polysaccharide lyase [Gilvimarinus agarilyticus]|uniref:polysaccharide lyase n=1 Tax=Gilvimarinus agarilyticus TaxID=679259 RepID=UPI00059EEDBE|nr:polysaccharide lyase [Gilvimarinus agarilyticus]
MPLPRLATLASLMLLASSARAELLWQADFETGDLSQWPYITNPVGASITSDCTYEGQYAGQIAITGDEKYLWHGNEALNRSEFNYQPAATGEGDTTYIGWSFYLPAPLLSVKHEIGYWESGNSWQQQMRFNLIGETLSFTRSDATEPYWSKPGFASAGVWHDVAMAVHWSTDPAQGYVDIWLDGKAMGRTQMQTRVNNTDPMFTQIGLLRHRVAQREVILIDNVRAADNIDDVLAAFNPQEPKTCP